MQAMRRLISPLTLRWTSAHHVTIRMLTAPVTSDSPKQFKDIPGPKGYPFIGTALDYRNDKYTMSRVMKRRLDKYGTIYREAVIPVLPEQVVIFDPKDIEVVFRADGEWPIRPHGGDLTKKVSQATGLDVIGLVSSQGEQWHKMRSPMSKFMMVPRKVAEYHEDFNKITLDLLKNVETKKDSNSILTDVSSLLFKWAFESVAYFCLNKRLGALSSSGEVSPESQEFITSVRRFFDDLTNLMFSLPLYRFYPTKQWKTLINTNKTIHKLARYYIEERLAEIEEKDKKALEAASGDEEAPDKVDFLAYLVHSGKMSIEEVSVNVVDLLTAGVETTANTLGFALCCLGSNPEAQEKLRIEIQSVVRSDEIVTPAHINEMNYLRSVLKETQRLYPLAGLNQRALTQDVVLSGYSVPKGTEVTMPQMLIGRMPELFSEPDSFIPERWNRENRDNLPSMFAQLPFGFGPRMCIGRRTAELEVHIALAHLIRTYQVEYLEKEPMGFLQMVFLRPDRQVDLTFNKI